MGQISLTAQHLMPPYFAKWVSAHALSLMGPIALCFPYFYGKMGFDFPLMAQHLVAPLCFAKWDIAHALYLIAQIQVVSDG